MLLGHPSLEERRVWRVGAIGSWKGSPPRTLDYKVWKLNTEEDDTPYVGSINYDRSLLGNHRETPQGAMYFSKISRLR